MRRHALVALALAGGCAAPPPSDRTTPEQPGGTGEGTGGTSSQWGSSGPMYGDLHRLIFNITGFCDGVCPNRYVLLAGTKDNGAAVNLPPFGVPAAPCRTFRIQSSNPAVVSLRGTNPRNADRLCIAVGDADNMLADANAPGDALLTVFDDAGQVFDRIDIHVRQAAGVLLWESVRRDVAGALVAIDRQDKDPLSRQFSAFPVDAAGLRIVAHQRITYEIADPTIATFFDFFGGGEVAKLDSPDIALVHPLAAGTTTLTLTIQGLQRRYTLVVK